MTSPPFCRGHSKRQVPVAPVRVVNTLTDSGFSLGILGLMILQLGGATKETGMTHFSP